MRQGRGTPCSACRFRMVRPSGENTPSSGSYTLSPISMENWPTSSISRLTSRSSAVGRSRTRVVSWISRCSGDHASNRRLSDQRQTRPVSRRSSSQPDGPSAKTQTPSNCLCLSPAITAAPLVPLRRYASVRPVSTLRKKTPSSQSMRSPASKMRRSKTSAAGSMHSTPRQGTGVGVGSDVGDGVGVAVGVGVGDGVATGVGAGVAVRVGTAVGVSVGATVAVGVGLGVGVGGRRGLTAARHRQHRQRDDEPPNADREHTGKVARRTRAGAIGDDWARGMVAEPRAIADNPATHARRAASGGPVPRPGWRRERPWNHPNARRRKAHTEQPESRGGNPIHAR